MQRLRNTGSAKEETENGIQEVFEVIAVAASYPVRLETEPTGLGVATVIFSKIDTYGAVGGFSLGID